MRPGRAGFGCLFLIVLSATAQQNPVGRAVIEGTVVEGVTGNAIAGAEVVIFIFRNPADAQVLRATTTQRGQFLLENVPPGDHSLNVSKGGYLQSSTISVIVKPGGRLTGITVRLTPTGVISGRVQDSGGRPLVRAQITLLRYRYSRDVLRPWFPSMVVGDSRWVTDDRGEFRVFDLNPGRYYILFRPPPTSIPGGLLYPGVRELSQAERIEVKSGEEVRLREVRMNDRTSASGSGGWIRVNIVNGTGTRLPQSVNVSLSPPGWEGAFGLVERRTMNGIQEFQPYLAGIYEIYSAFLISAGNAGGGHATVQFSGEDVSVELVLTRLQGQLSGRVLTDSSKPLPGVEVEFLGKLGESAFTAADGTFKLSGLSAGEYRFQGVTDLPEEYFVTSVRAAGRNLLQEPVTVSERTPEVEVVVSPGAGGIAGRVGRDAIVVLTGNGFLLAVPSKPDGSFELAGIPPGDYELYAWSETDDVEPRDAAFMERFKGKGTPVRLEKGGRLRMDVKILEN